MSNLVINLLLSLNCFKLGTIISYNTENQKYKVQLGFRNKRFYNTANKPDIIECEAFYLKYFQGQYDINDVVVVFFTDYNQENFINTKDAINNSVDLTNRSNLHAISNGVILFSFEKFNDSLNYAIKIVNKLNNASIILDDESKIEVKADTVEINATSFSINQKNSTATSVSTATTATPATDIKFEAPLNPENTKLNKSMGKVFAKDLPEKIAGNVVSGCEFIYNMIKDNLPEVAGVKIGDALPDFSSFKDQLTQQLMQLLQPYIALVEMVLKVLTSDEIKNKTPSRPTLGDVKCIINREEVLLKGDKTYKEQGYNYLYTDNIYDPCDPRKNVPLLLQINTNTYPTNDTLWTTCEKCDYSCVVIVNNSYQMHLEKHKT